MKILGIFSWQIHIFLQAFSQVFHRQKEGDFHGILPLNSPLKSHEYPLKKPQLTTHEMFHISQKSINKP